MSTVSLRCRCGKVRGKATEVSRETGNRLLCYCDDCQAFAHFLKRRDVLDERGGTDIFQMAPSRVEVTEGATELRSMRLSEKGLLRWYVGCCNTPVGNTVSARLPFVGLIHSFMDHDGDGHPRDGVLGEPIGYVHGKFAIGGNPPHATGGALVRIIARSTRLMLGWWISGRGKSSPFFDSDTQLPRAKPHVLTAAERSALR